MGDSEKMVNNLMHFTFVLDVAFILFTLWNVRRADGIFKLKVFLEKCRSQEHQAEEWNLKATPSYCFAFIILIETTF